MFLALYFALVPFAQVEQRPEVSVTNVVHTRRGDYSTYEICYTLAAADPRMPVRIGVALTLDDGKTYFPATKASGDIGDGVRAGRHCIEWNIDEILTTLPISRPVVVRGQPFLVRATLTHALLHLRVHWYMDGEELMSSREATWIIKDWLTGNTLFRLHSNSAGTGDVWIEGGKQYLINQELPKGWQTEDDHLVTALTAGAEAVTDWRNTKSRSIKSYYWVAAGASGIVIGAIAVAHYHSPR